MTLNDITTLVLKAQAGDRAAYGELVRRFEPSVYAVALARLRRPGEAQELTQEVFVHGMTKLGQLRDPHCFAGWLRQITVRMAINHQTRRGPLAGAKPDFLDNVQATTAGPLEEMIRSEQRTSLRAGLAKLKPLDRATLEAFYLRGQSLKQMSREFETPIGTIKRRLHIARQRLRRQLEGMPASSKPKRPRRQRELACV
ncbi:MAG: RNA polymerase sigma factor [Gemmataceae bacterium]